MLSIEAAIIEKLQSGSCCFDDVVTDLPNFSWGKCSPLLIGCHVTGGYRFVKMVILPIGSF